MFCILQCNHLVYTRNQNRNPELANVDKSKISSVKRWVTRGTHLQRTVSSAFFSVVVSGTKCSLCQLQGENTQVQTFLLIEKKINKHVLLFIS